MTDHHGGAPSAEPPAHQVAYFSYGSNLDTDQMAARCASAQIVRRAVLPHHALAFGGFSHAWGGAVANVLPRRGARVEGLIYQLTRTDLHVLDRYEGHPYAYEREQRYVIDEHGRRHRVSLYVQPARDFDPGPPSRAYLGVIACAYQRHGFNLGALVAAAHSEPQPACPEPASATLVFTYGTLLAGERNHRLLQTARFVGATSTLPRYELRDLGAFPGLVRGGTRAIAGELYEVDAPTLFALDRLEGHPTFYRRARIRLASGTIADTYLLRRDQVASRPIIESNNWRTRAEEP
jgi:gamma-glutamylcyclotransferase (GGCT)/AIG2-like uncharacterized protein YtfP